MSQKDHYLEIALGLTVDLPKPHQRVIPTCNIPFSSHREILQQFTGKDICNKGKTIQLWSNQNSWMLVVPFKTLIDTVAHQVSNLRATPSLPIANSSSINPRP
ncbi:hypothetical protein GOBAR_DD25662 [Gossypium barbadense]|nr:hypothetical protein GOBAR_DD25662 [Gossypium barbadense]